MTDADIEQLTKEFRETFSYTRQGQWFRKVDGFEDEDGNFVERPHKAYAVPDFIEQFLIQAVKTAYEDGRFDGFWGAIFEGKCELTIHIERGDTNDE